MADFMEIIFLEVGNVVTTSLQVKLLSVLQAVEGVLDYMKHSSYKRVEKDTIGQHTPLLPYNNTKCFALILALLSQKLE